MFTEWLSINFYMVNTYTKLGCISTLISVRIKYLLKKGGKTPTIKMNLLKILTEC